MGALRTIFELGVKELRSLYRDPVLSIFIVFAFTVIVYSVANSASMEIKKVHRTLPGNAAFILRKKYSLSR